MKRKIEVKCEEWRGGNTMTANPILLQKKYARVIECFAKQQGLSLDEALGLFYHKIGRIPPFLLGGGMNAAITIYRQM